MDFDLNEDQRLLHETLTRFFAKEFSLTEVRSVFESDEGMSADLWSALAGLGVLGALVDEAHGGMGLELLDLAVAAECLGYAGAPGPFLEHVLAALAISLGGSDAQRDRWLPGLADGSIRATYAVAEGGERWLPESWTLDADQLLTGSKHFVLSASGADLTVVGTSGGGFTLVEGGAAGMTTTTVEVLDRTRRFATVELDGVAHDPLPNGVEASGPVHDAALVLLAADAYGGAVRCVEMSVEYAKAREQFGVTIGHFQGLKHQLANMALEVEPTRGLSWYAAHAFDHVPDDASRFAALAKAHITDRYVEASRRAVEAHGGIGYTWECDVQFFLKRAVFDRAMFGNSAVQRRRVAALNGW